MANQYGINMGEVYSQAAGIKAQRQKNKLTGMKIDAEQKRRDNAKLRNHLKKSAMKGNDEALKNLTTMDAETGKKVLEARKTMKEQQRKEVERRADIAGRYGAAILQSDKPEEQYQRVRQALAQDPDTSDMAEQMPEQYDPAWVQTSVARAREVEKIMDPGKREQFTVGDKDYLLDDGNIRMQAKSSEAKERDMKAEQRRREAQQESGVDLKASDENAMYRQATGLYGGIYDPATGKISGMTENDVPKVQAIVGRAAELFNNGEEKTRSSAVNEAARQLDIPIEDLEKRSNDQRKPLTDEEAEQTVNQLLNLQ